jgi:excisionase family DNA binding protein
MEADRNSALLNAWDVATRLGVSVHAVRAWTRTGKLRAIRLGRRVRYDPRTIDAVLASGGLGLPATRTPMPWTLRAAARYVAELGGDNEMARAALDLVAPREGGCG